MIGFTVTDTFGNRRFDGWHRWRIASDGALVVTYDNGDIIAVFAAPFRIETAP